MQSPNRHWFGARKSVSATRRGRRCPVEVGLLEGRMLLSGDITPPVTSATVVQGVLGNNGIFKTPITVQLSPSDPDSPDGLATFYNIDNTGLVEGNTLQLGDGNHTVQFYSVDQSHNQESIRTETFNIDTTVPVVTAAANPTSLWPPNHKFVPVTITGHVSDLSGGVPVAVRYSVSDEYVQVQPSGQVPVDTNGNYSFVVQLQSSRLGQDKDGRQYTILVTATDQAGNTGMTTTFVVVPHDQGHHAGNGNGDKGQGGNSNHGHGNGKGRGNGTVVFVPPGQSSGLNQGDDNGQGGNGHHGNGNHGHGKGGGNGTVVFVPPGQSGGLNQGGDNGQGGNGNHGQDNNGNGNNGHGHGHG